jgi:arylsulfatase A-like enzyme/tetratricopeptide (TPR) repeat protein
MKSRFLSRFPAWKRVTRRHFAMAGILALALLSALLTLRPPLRHWQRQRRLRNLNVILITIDTLRADYVSAYKPGRAATPVMDALADSGVRFDHCVSQAPLTLPSHASILSATQPLFHRVRDNGASRAPADLILLSEVLGKHGFATAAFIGGYVLHSKWGLNQGFDFYSDRFEPDARGNLLQDKKPAGTVLGDARRWLDEHGGQRFFIWIHLYDPHFPYTPPSPFAERCGNDPYRGEVEYADNEMGRFFDYLRQKGWYDQTLIVVTADHGEGLNDHGEQKHGYFLYETTIHVPLIIRAPLPFAARTIPQTVQLVDVAPTVLDLLGIQAPAQWQGRSMQRLMAGLGDDRFHSAYSETWYPRLHFGWSSLQAFTSDQMKYIFSPRDELYDLRGDPGEEHNQAGARPRQRSDLRGRGLAFINRHEKGALTPGNLTSISMEDKRRLAALGYLSGSATVPAPTGPLADPKDKLPDYIAFGKAVSLLADSRWDEALGSAQGIVERNPEFADAVNLMGNAHYGRQRFPEALRAFRRALKLKPEDPFFRLDLLKTLQALGQFDAAAAETEHFLLAAPNDASLLATLGRIRLAQNRDEQGQQLLLRALAIDPGVFPMLNQAAETLIARRELPAAREILQGILRTNPRATDSHYLLAQIEETQHRLQPAMDLYRRELETNPGKFEAAVNLANLLKQGGDLTGAARYYRMAVEANGNLKLPRFHLAEIMLKQGQDLPQAIELCQKGIAMPPRDRETLFGYFVLTNLYAALGDSERRDFFTRAGEKLIASLENR